MTGMRGAYAGIRSVAAARKKLEVPDFTSKTVVAQPATISVRRGRLPMNMSGCQSISPAHLTCSIWSPNRSSSGHVRHDAPRPARGARHARSRQGVPGRLEAERTRGRLPSHPFRRLSPALSLRSWNPCDAKFAWHPCAVPIAGNGLHSFHLNRPPASHHPLIRLTQRP